MSRAGAADVAVEVVGWFMVMRGIVGGGAGRRHCSEICQASARQGGGRSGRIRALAPFRPTTMSLSIRPAQAADHAPLEALQRRASLGNAGDRGFLLQHPELIALPPEHISDGRVFLAESGPGGPLLGFATLLSCEDDALALELEALFVEPSAWRRGVGRALLDHGCRVARGAGARSLRVLGNGHAESFYRRCGFEVLGHQAMRFGTALQMRLNLV